MANLKRPFQDETLFSPCQRNFYNRTTIGRPGDPREEPIKYTQALNDEFHADIWTEWMAREAGCAHISKFIHLGELDAETEAMKKIDGFMEDINALCDHSGGEGTEEGGTDTNAHGETGESDNGDSDSCSGSGDTDNPNTDVPTH